MQCHLNKSDIVTSQVSKHCHITSLKRKNAHGSDVKRHKQPAKLGPAGKCCLQCFQKIMTSFWMEFCNVAGNDLFFSLSVHLGLHCQRNWCQLCRQKQGMKKRSWKPHTWHLLQQLMKQNELDQSGNNFLSHRWRGTSFCIVKFHGWFFLIHICSLMDPLLASIETCTIWLPAQPTFRGWKNDWADTIVNCKQLWMLKNQKPIPKLSLPVSPGQAQLSVTTS